MKGRSVSEDAQVRPATDETHTTAVRSVVEAAVAAARPWRAQTGDERANALTAVADTLDARSSSLTRLAREETHLAAPRLRGELRRTTFQLRFFADLIRSGGHIAATVDHADEAWPMGAPRPDLRRHTRPVGPVVVFAAGNFPFAFSVAGGDTASALAAGCPVVVKAHPGHPALSRETADVVAAALLESGAPEGVFALVEGVEAGLQVLRHPGIRAASFTGSIRGGRALLDVANARPVPIPFYGELGSTNPVVVTPGAAIARPEEIAQGFVTSVTGSSGQLCTKPGLLFVPESSPVLESLRGATLPATHPLLDTRIDHGYREGLARLRAHRGVEMLASADGGDAVLLTVDAATFAEDMEALGEECFGPAAIVVRYSSVDEPCRILEQLPGQLTASVVAQDSEVGSELVRELMDVAAELAGRVLWNQWPTGVSVTWAQQHGGPYPAATHPLSTSVGSAAIERFLRPVAYQGVPEELLPDELREHTSFAARRLVDGRTS